MLKLMAMSFSKVTLDILDVQQCSADCTIRVSKYLYPLLSFIYM